jgi:acetate kinase
MPTESLVLVVNPGSASRKYALFADGKNKAAINFEFVNGHVFGKVEYAGEKYEKNYDDADLSNVSRYILPLLHEYKIISEDNRLEAIGIRVVAPSKRFMQDELVTGDIESAFEAVQQKAPLHVTTVLAEIKHLENYFQSIPIITVSDSAFHATKPTWAWHYGIDVDLAEKFGILRYGYHGISVGSVIRRMQDANILQPKTIVCHIGGGSSLTAVSDGKSVDNTMGYTPLEGLMMASRSGTIDVSAALAIKRELNLSDDELEEYLNKKSGLSGVSGSSSDIRQLLASEQQGDERASLALKLFVYRIQQAVGQMAASLSGVDCIVFTATIGERSSVIRSRILDGLGYLGFAYDAQLNDQTFEPAEPVNLANGDSKPAWVIATDEAAEIAERAGQYVKNMKAAQGQNIQ